MSIWSYKVQTPEIIINESSDDGERNSAMSIRSPSTTLLSQPFTTLADEKTILQTIKISEPFGGVEFRGYRGAGAGDPTALALRGLSGGTIETSFSASNFGIINMSANKGAGPAAGAPSDGDVIFSIGNSNVELAVAQLTGLWVRGGIGAFATTPPGAQPSKITDPSGGATVDAEARTAIDALIDVLEGAGFAANA